MRADGLRVESPDGVEVTEVRALHVCEVATLRDPFDLVIFGVKAYDTRWSAELIKPLLAPGGAAVGIQNGMSVAATADVLGLERTLGAVIEIAGNMFTPGVVDRQVGRSGTWFALGAPDPAARDRVPAMAEALGHAGRVDVTDDVLSSKWMKLVANAAEMVPSAILGVPLVEALHVDGMREVMDAAGTEALVTSGSRSATGSCRCSGRRASRTCRPRPTRVRCWTWCSAAGRWRTRASRCCRTG
jgi:2-dehydropantoate 2-reductase